MNRFYGIIGTLESLFKLSFDIDAKRGVTKRLFRRKVVVFGTAKSHLSALITGFLLLGAGLGIAAEEANNNIQPQGLNYAGVSELKKLLPKLTGAGVKMGLVSRSITYVDGEPQNDYRPAINHNCFKGLKYFFNDQQNKPAGVSSHSTAICSILFGRDANAFNEKLGDFRYEGLVPEAEAGIYEFWSFLVNNVFPCKAPDANVLTADIGYQFEAWWTRGIEALAQKYGLTVVMGIGNGSNSSDPVLFPGAGGNVIGVGVVKSVESNDVNTGLSQFSLVYPEYSSKGLTSDGRCKPDIVAPGNCLAAAADEPNNYQPTGDWSSFATPVVAGTAALLIESAMDDANLNNALSSDGGNCVIKSVLLNSATKLPYWHKGLLAKEDDQDVPLDFMQGAGMLNAAGANRQLTAGQYSPGDCPITGWDLNKLGNPKIPANSYKIQITEPLGKMISATIAWNKQFSFVYPFEHRNELDADLRLELWAVDLNDPNRDYMLDASDSRNDNLEHIYTLGDANFSDYEIVVLFSTEHEINQPESAIYAIAWNVTQQPQRNDSLWLDLSADGVVNDVDINVLVNNMTASMGEADHYLFGDIDSDGMIDVNDLDVMKSYIESIAKN